MTNNDLQNKITSIDINIICIYLTIISSIMYLIIYYKERDIIINKWCNANCQSKYPDTANYNKIIALIAIVTNGVFLYNAYINLQDSINEYKKTGNSTGLDSSYNSFYANTLEFAGSLIDLYNTFINNSDINILP